MIFGELIAYKTSQNTPTAPMLSGTVTVNGSGVRKRIMIQNRMNLQYIASTHSNTDGTWSIVVPEYPPRMLVAMAYDDSVNGFNAEIIDFITAV